MTRNVVRGPAAVLLTAVVLSMAAACSGGGGNASSAASAAASAASRAAEVVASATAAAGEKLKGFKNGVNAKGDVKVGSPATGTDGHATAKVTVTNSTGSTKSYAVQINFRDGKGNLVDTVVVTVDHVAAKASKNATARSNRKLSGKVVAEVGTALRN
ncbi:hypothetical protein ACWCXX_02225 [Streptomyces sp. NPDC001732]